VLNREKTALTNADDREPVGPRQSPYDEDESRDAANDRSVGWLRQQTQKREATGPRMLNLRFDPPAIEMPMIHDGARAVSEVVVTNLEQQAIEIDSFQLKGDHAFAVLSAGPSVLQPGEKAFVSIVFTSQNVGDHAALLEIRTADGAVSLAPIHGKCEARPTPPRAAEPDAQPDVDAGDKAAEERGPVDVTPLAAADQAPANAAEARAMLKQAADAIAGLRPSYDVLVGSHRSAAITFIDECATATGTFNGKLIAWLSDEMGSKISDLGDSSLQDWWAFAFSRLMDVPVPGGDVLGILVDTVFHGLSLGGPPETNRKVADGTVDAQFLGDVLAGASDQSTRQIVRGMASLFHKFGVVEGQLLRVAIDDAAFLTKHIELEIASGNTKPALQLHADAARLVEEFRALTSELGASLRSIASARNQFVHGVDRMLARLKDAYLEFVALGRRSPRTNDRRQVRVSGNVNLEHAGTHGEDVSLAIYNIGVSSSNRDERNNVGDMSGTMKAHVAGKRLGDLAGWDVEIALSISQGGDMLLKQTADGARSASGSTESHQATVWQILERNPFGLYWSS
jgi:hypothetical protein